MKSRSTWQFSLILLPFVIIASISTLLFAQSSPSISPLIQVVNVKPITLSYNQDKQSFVQNLIYNPSPKKQIILDKISESDAAMGVRFLPESLRFSPDQNYLVYSKSGYEWAKTYVVNLNTLQNIISDEKLFYVTPENINWSPDNTLLVILSYHEDFRGTGTDGIFVSEIDNRDKLKLIFSLTTAQHFNNVIISNVEISPKNIITFNVTNGKTVTSYLYNPSTSKLTTYSK